MRTTTRRKRKRRRRSDAVSDAMAHHNAGHVRKRGDVMQMPKSRFGTCVLKLEP